MTIKAPSINDTTLQASSGGGQSRTASRLAMAEFYVTAVVLVIGVALAVLSGNIFVLSVCNYALLAMIGATGLNMLMGTAGLISIGNAAFVSVGAFGVAIFQRTGIPMPFDIILAVLAAALFGTFVGLPALRIRGIYLLLSSMAAHFLAAFVFEQYQSAEVGVSGFPVERIVGPGSFLDQQRFWAGMLLLVVILTIFVATKLQFGRLGRAWRMMRDREAAAPAIGINVARNKIMAFTISSGIVGLQGALLAHYTGNVSYDAFPLSLAIAAIAMILIGGLGSVSGAVIGAAVVTLLPYATSQVMEIIYRDPAAVQYSARISQIIYGILIVVFVSYAREGLRGWVVSLAGYVLRSFRGDRTR